MSSGVRERVQSNGLSEGGRAESAAGLRTSAVEAAPALSTTSTERLRTNNEQHLRDISQQSVSSSVTPPVQIQEIARTLAERLRQLRAMEVRSYQQNQAFEQHLSEIVSLMLESGQKYADLDEEFSRVYGMGMGRAVTAFSSGALAQSGSRRHLAVLRAAVQLETARLGETSNGHTDQHSVRTRAWATTLSREYLRPLLASTSSEERANRIKALEEALLEQRRMRSADSSVPSLIDCLVEVHSAEGLDFFVEASKACGASELALSHAIVLEIEPRIDALLFVRRLGQAESIADLVSYFPETQDVQAFEREVQALTGSEPAELLMQRSLTMCEGPQRLRDDAVYQSELKVVEALFSPGARTELYRNGHLETIRSAARNAREAAQREQDLAALAQRSDEVQVAATSEGVVRAVHLALEQLPTDSIESTGFDPRSQGILLSARALSLKVETQRLSQGLGLDVGIHVREPEAVTALRVAADARIHDVTQQVLSRIHEVPEGFLREQYLNILTQQLLDSNQSVAEALTHADQAFGALVQELGDAALNQTASEFLAQLEALQGQTRPQQFLAMSRLFSELPPEVLHAVRLHADASGASLEDRIRGVGGERLLEFARAVEADDDTRRTVMTMEELLSGGHAEAVVNLLIACPAGLRSDAIAQFGSRNGTTMLKALERAGLPQELRGQLELALSGSPTELATLQCERAMGLHGGTPDFVALNDLLLQLSPEQRAALAERLLTPNREALIARVQSQPGVSQAMAELVVQLVEQGPQPQDQIAQAAVFLAQMREREQVRQEALELLNHRLEQNESYRRGALASARELERQMDEQDFLVSGWSWVTGVSSAVRKDAENNRQLATEYAAQRQVLLAAQQEAGAAAEQTRAAEAEALNALVFGRQQAALDAARRANLSFNQFAEVMNNPSRTGALPDFTRYNAETEAFRSRLDSSIRSLDNWETGLKVARTGVIIVGGAAVVVATGGAALPAWQAALLVTAAAAPGTAVQGIMDVQYGNKTVRQATIDSAWQTGGDFLNAWGAGSLSRALFSPRVLVTGGGEAVGQGLLRQGGRYSMREVTRIVGQRVGPMWVRTPEGLRVGAMLTEHGMVNLQRLSSIPEISRGIAALLFRRDDSQPRNQRSAVPQSPTPEAEKPAEAPPRPFERRPLVEPIPIEMGLEEESEEERLRRVARPATTVDGEPSAEPPPVEPSAPGAPLTGNMPGVDGPPPGPTPEAPPITPASDQPQPPPPPGDSQSSGAVPFDPLGALLRMFGIGRREGQRSDAMQPPVGSVPPHRSEPASEPAPEKVQESANTTPATSAISPAMTHVGASVGNSYTAAVQNAQRSPALNSAHDRMYIGDSRHAEMVRSAERDELQRETAQARELELERIRFLEQRNQRAIQESIQLAERNRRWMEELQAMAQQQLAAAIAAAEGRKDALKDSRGNSLSSGHSTVLSHQIPSATGVSNSASQELATGHARQEGAAFGVGVFGRQELQRALSHGQASAEPASLTLARVTGVESVQKELSGLMVKSPEAPPLVVSHAASERAHTSAAHRHRRANTEQASERMSLARVDGSQLDGTPEELSAKPEGLTTHGLRAAPQHGVSRLARQVLTTHLVERLTTSHGLTSNMLSVDLSAALNRAIESRYLGELRAQGAPLVAAVSFVDSLSYRPAVPYEVRIAQHVLQSLSESVQASGVSSVSSSVSNQRDVLQGSGSQGGRAASPKTQGSGSVAVSAPHTNVVMDHSSGAVNGGAPELNFSTRASMAPAESLAGGQVLSGAPQSPVRPSTSALSGTPTYSFLAVEVPGGAIEGDGRLEQYLRDEQRRIEDMEESSLRRLRAQRRRKKLRAQRRAELAARRLIEKLTEEALSLSGEDATEDELEARAEKLLVARVRKSIARKPSKLPAARPQRLGDGVGHVSERETRQRLVHPTGKRSLTSKTRDRRLSTAHRRRPDEVSRLERSRRGGAPNLSRISSRADAYRRHKRMP